MALIVALETWLVLAYAVWAVARPALFASVWASAVCALGWDIDFGAHPAVVTSVAGVEALAVDTVASSTSGASAAATSVMTDRALVSHSGYWGW